MAKGRQGPSAPEGLGFKDLRHEECGMAGEDAIAQWAERGALRAGHSRVCDRFWFPRAHHMSLGSKHAELRVRGGSILEIPLPGDLFLHSWRLT